MLTQPLPWAAYFMFGLAQELKKVWQDPVYHQNIKTGISPFETQTHWAGRHTFSE